MVLFVVASCSSDPSENKPADKQQTKSNKPPKFQLFSTPEFNADSAYAYIEKQVAFGPRVPNTEAHKKCALWLEQKLASFGLSTSVQKTKVTAYNGDPLSIFNITGSTNPEAAKRILLCAHWDTRPYADRDDEKIRQPIDGANDGASGVGVLLEIARVLMLDSLGPNVGVDIVFFDAEDYGKPQGSMLGNSNDSWCLGSQYWSNNLPEDYAAEYGILLDMVGAANAVFPKEGISMYYAPQIVNRVWKIAAAMGHAEYFPSYRGSDITDDHRYINQIAGIPCIDILHYEMGRNDFGTFHHTHDDNMDIISTSTLKVVGDVVLQVLYQE